MKTHHSEDTIDRDDEVQLGELEPASPKKKSSGAIVAVRVPADLFEAVSDYAVTNGLTTSEVFRTGAERLIGRTSVGPMFVSATLVVSAGGRIIQGSPTSGIGHSRREEVANPSLALTTPE